MATELTKAPEWRRDIEEMTQEFTRSLPAQVPTERFVRTILTAVQTNPDLAKADRHTLKVACLRAAQDGLLPDGREGVLNVYNTKVKREGREVWINAAQWMPMVAGLQKKARNSGELAGLTGHVVYKHDQFMLVLGDEEKLEHVPNLEAADSDMIEDNAIGAYAIATLKDGTKIRAWRPRSKIMLAKSQSKAPNGLMWTKFWEEGWIKTAIRYLTKSLPSSSDKEGADAFARAAQRDDDTYDFNQGKDVTPQPVPVGNRLEDLVAKMKPAVETPEHDADGVVQEPQEATATEPPEDTLMDLEAAGEAPSGPGMVLLTKVGPKPRSELVMTVEEASRVLRRDADPAKKKKGARWCSAALELNPWIDEQAPDLKAFLVQKGIECLQDEDAATASVDLLAATEEQEA